MFVVPRPRMLENTTQYNTSNKQNSLTKIVINGIHLSIFLHFLDRFLATHERFVPGKARQNLLNITS